MPQKIKSKLYPKWDGRRERDTGGEWETRDEERMQAEGDGDEDGAEVRWALFTHQSAFPFPLSAHCQLRLQQQQLHQIAISATATATSTSAAAAIDI